MFINKMENKRSETIFIVPQSFDRMNAEIFLRKHCAVSARLLTRLKRTENGITRNGELLRSIDKVNARRCNNNKIS